MSYKRIQASEIGDYVYCRRSWWLRQAKGYAPQNMRELQAGQQFHQAHGRSLQQSSWLRRLAYVLLFVTVTYITFQILLGI
jgi:CRISPR/Cas system-associated exonuclease Cas4 (RecB family)